MYFKFSSKNTIDQDLFDESKKTNDHIKTYNVYYTLSD